MDVLNFAVKGKVIGRYFCDKVIQHFDEICEKAVTKIGAELSGNTVNVSSYTDLPILNQIVIGYLN